MNIILVLIFMIFFHILDDFHFQGVLASMKQRKWWEENAPDALYRNDYFVALFIHGFSWAVMVFIPVFVYRFYMGMEILDVGMLILFIATFYGHAYIDDKKANIHSINLITDQLLHLVQILWIWVWYVLYATFVLQHADF